MKTSYEAEGTAYRRALDVEDQRAGQGQPTNHAASASILRCTCAANIPMLSPHEIATLMLVAHTPGEVSAECADLQPLLNVDLVQINRCHACLDRPHVTSLGERLVARFRKTTMSHIGKSARA